MNLFEQIGSDLLSDRAPLAQRLKPKTLEDFVGQSQILGKGSFLRQMISKDRLCSIILHGPPGTGKTSIAEIIAGETKSKFIKMNAVTSGVTEIKNAISAAKEAAARSKRTILFIDEIHRFNKRQQDALLPHVESGLLTLVGATTENPYFEVNSALISRVTLLKLESLGREEISRVLKRALDIDAEISECFNDISDDAIDMLYKYSAGDARKALNALESSAIFAEESATILDAALLKRAFEANSIRYDKSGDMHYDVISAFIKSIRGSDPQAALHYLARMLEAGEDPMFIARRLVISASEDIGNADPMGLLIANAAKDAVHFVGMPEARIALAQATSYLASTPKSNKAYLAINKALEDVKTLDIGDVPTHLRDSSYSGAAKLGNALDYKYPHDYSGAYVRQDYLPDKLRGKIYYEPSGRGREKTLRQYLRQLDSSADE